ncbi:hypothetical protein [Winogradskyella sp. 3972H.M.0a.05]|uniref:transglutaminase domain-containing protein n=1 Tax=Winogradskyella sp. 3972H.M.0a.05 TaxID=2950277 RepID=UPI0033945406
MKRLRTTSLFILFLTSLLNAQNDQYHTEYHVIEKDLKENTIALDSTAKALVIYEYGNSYIDRNTYNLTTEIKRKIKIIDKDAFDEGNITVVLYKNKSNKEKVSKIKATSYEYNGSKIIATKLEKSDIYTEEYDKNHDVVKFAIPNIKEGSVITYSYTFESPFRFNYYPWSFQSKIPKLYSEYNTSIPGNWEYNIKLKGDLKLKSHDKSIKKKCLSSGSAYASCAIAKYIMVDIPAFIEEDYMTAKENFLSKIEFELSTFTGFDGSVNKYTKNWKDADKEIKSEPNLGSHFYKKSSVSSITNAIPHDSEIKMAKNIFEHIKKNFAWNKKYKLFSKKSIKQLVKNKSGTATEINILLLNALHAKGIDAKPVLISTRKNGLPTKLYPVISEFNYLIVQAKIDGETYFLDATDKYLPFGLLPHRCLNSYGRVFDFKNGSYWTDIAYKKMSYIQHSLKLQLNDEDLIEGSVSSRYFDYKALPVKASYYKGSENYNKYMGSYFSPAVIENHELIYGKESGELFEDKFDISIDTEAIGDKLYINPFLFSFFEQNPFKLQERTYPIDFGYKDNYTYKAELKLNDAYEVLELPEEFSIVLPNNSGQLLFNVTKKESDILIFMKLSFNQYAYPPEYYPHIKEFFNKVIDTQKNALIVLKKK